MEKLTLGPDAFDRVDGFEFATKQFSIHENTLTDLSITFREPRQLDEGVIRSLLSKAKQISGLKKLELGNVDLRGRDTGMALHDVLLQWSSTLEEIRISCCLVNEDFAEQARKSLVSLKHLKVLVVANCSLWDEPLFRILLEPIKRPLSLTYLCLSSCGLTSASFTLLCKIFSQHPSLELLNLSSNRNLFQCDSINFGIFLTGLITLQKLRSLNIHQCGTDVTGAIAVFRALKNLPNLVRLIVNHDNGALDECRMENLPRRVGVFSTVCSGRQIHYPSEAEIDAIIDIIRQNTSLTNVDIAVYSSRFHASLSQVLTHNRCIRKAKLLLSKMKRLPINYMPELMISLRHPDEEATTQFMILHSSVERWTRNVVS